MCDGSSMVAHRLLPVVTGYTSKMTVSLKVVYPYMYGDIGHLRIFYNFHVYKHYQICRKYLYQLELLLSVSL